MTEIAESHHTVRGYDVDLTGLRMKLLEMGGLVHDQVQRATRALLQNDRDLARGVLAREREVNEYDLNIDEDGIALIARRQPMGSDLRVVISIARAVADLERVGDEAKKIALHVLNQDAAHITAQLKHDVRHMAPLAAAMVHGALDAFDRMDATAAVEVARRDRELNDQFHASVRRLVTVAMEDPRRLQSIVDSMFVLKSLERIGDHAKSIARYVIYLVQGRDVRHDDTLILSDPSPDAA